MFLACSLFVKFRTKGNKVNFRFLILLFLDQFFDFLFQFCNFVLLGQRPQSIEFLTGRDTRVLETAEVGVGKLVEITDLALEDLPPAVGFAVCRAIEPAEEVRRTVVKGIIDEMMYLSDVGFAVLADEDGTFAVMSECHEDVAVLAAEMAHERCIVPSLRLFGVLCWGIRVLKFLSLRAEKIAIWVSPEDFAVDNVRRYLFATFG